MKKEPSPFLPMALAALLVTGAVAWRGAGYHAGYRLPPERRSLAAPAAVGQRAATAAERQQAINSIQAQLQAFAKGDFAAASKYQCAILHQKFSSPATFEAMIRSQYPRFITFRSVRYGRARCDQAGRFLTISVQLTGTDRVSVQALYQMLKEHGTYRVVGVLGGMTAPPRRGISA